MTGNTIHARALHRAAVILGGKEKLRELLRVSGRELDAWIAGNERPPTDVFLKAVDVISADRAQTIQDARQLRQKSEALRREIAETRAHVHAARREAQAFFKANYARNEGRAMVEAALDAAITATGADMGNVQLVLPEGLRIVAHRGFGQQFLDFYAVVVDGSAGSSCGLALKMGQRIVVPDVASSEIFVGTPAQEVIEAAGVRAVQSTPLVGPSGTLHGMLSTHCASRRDLAPCDEEALDRIARRAAFWLEGATAA